MNHDDHLALLRPGVAPGEPGAVWAELGAGDGAFTLALAELLGAGTIHTVDRDAAALERGARAVRSRYPNITLLPRQADFTRPLSLPPLDGLLMANALHFVRDQTRLLGHLTAYLKPGGRFLLVEYNADRGNLWVPHPLSYPTWAALAQSAGFVHVELLARYPSRFLNEIYASLATLPA